MGIGKPFYERMDELGWEMEDISEEDGVRQLLRRSGVNTTAWVPNDSSAGCSHSWRCVAVGWGGRHLPAAGEPGADPAQGARAALRRADAAAAGAGKQAVTEHGSVLT